MTRIHADWRNRVSAEYRSAALTAQVLHWSIQAGVSEGLLHTALRIVRDELDHAALSHDCLLALGGDPSPVGLDASALAALPTPGVLGGLVDSVVTNFCLGETFAVPLFAAMRRHATHPAVEPVLLRILRDEAVHRQFGWDLLDELLGVAPGVRDRVASGLPAALAGFRAAYAPDPDPAEVPLGPDEIAAGLLPPAEFARIFHETLDADILPRFAERGISAPATAPRAG